jgi:outer membrane lipase/esterase
MKTKLLRFVFFILALSATSIASSYANNRSAFSNFFFFGDSISDVGNIKIYTNAGGPIWVQDLMSRFGLSISPSKFGGNDFAYGDALTAGNNVVPNIPSLYDQVNQQIARSPGGELDSHAFYSILGGANDIAQFVLSGGFFGNGPGQAAVNMVSVANNLYIHGARYILLMNLPEAGYLSYPPAARAQVLANVAIFNSRLAQQFNDLDYDVVQADLRTLAARALANPTAYGFRTDAPTTPCPDNAGPCTGYFFAQDGVHPTTDAHHVIADYVYSILTAPNYYAALAENSRAVLRAENQPLIQQMTFLQNNGDMTGKWSPFINGNYAEITPPFNSTRNFTKFDSNYSALGIGTSYGVNSNWLLGAALAGNHSHTDFDTHSAQFTANSGTLNLYADYLYNRAYINGIASFTHTNFDNIDRFFNLGTKLVTTHGDTSGNQYGLNFNMGDNLIQGAQINSGPIANVELQRINVSGYTENSDEDEASIAYRGDHLNSFITGLGWQILGSKQLQNDVVLIGQVYASANKEWQGGDRRIGLHVVSLPGSHGSLPVFLPRPFFGEAGINVGANFTPRFSATVGGQLLAGQYHLRQYLLTAALNYQFL